jgi:hypothetical protein
MVLVHIMYIPVRWKPICFGFRALPIPIDAWGTRECHSLLVYFICCLEQHDTFRKLNLVRVQVKRMEGTCPLLPVRHSITKLRRRSSGTKRNWYVGTYWYTHTDSMTSSGACFIFLRKQSVADTWCILWQTCFEVKDPRSIPVYTFCVCVSEHRHAVKYTSFWLHLIMKLII